MEELLLDIIDRIRTRGSLGPEEVARLVQRRNHGYPDGCTHVSKRGLLPFYLKTKRNDPARWRSWNVTSELERELLAAIQMKPRRTASGVATITVITKPWPCASACLYCPNDVRMPKSYLANEPACQRAEHNFFDPYLQVVSRVRALAAMGHPIDKVELIVLGGTWTDYPENYQIWFVHELFRALNDEDAESHAAARREKLRAFGLENDPGILAQATRAAQARVDAGEETYNDAVASLYDASDAWRAVGRSQTATLQELESEQRRNETARRRVVGLVVETRPDAIDARSLTLARRLGCTKIQIGIQSLDGRVLEANDRQVDLNSIEHAFELMRAFGFKLHTHFMVNLYGQTPESDKRDYR
ncbi:radical SAM protein [Slackia exigua]|uniref:elongator complex protein 3 n=1 Tax=Slackia exigua TaxID=84109 RepID=UPI0028D7F58B|nr:radical SAM protein [Slackia exigua]